MERYAKLKIAPYAGFINPKLVPVYEGDKIPENKKSYAVSFHLQDTSKTLNEFQIEQIMKKLTDAFEKELGAQIRK